MPDFASPPQRLLIKSLCPYKTPNYPHWYGMTRIDSVYPWTDSILAYSVNSDEWVTLYDQSSYFG